MLSYFLGVPSHRTSHPVPEAFAQAPRQLQSSQEDDSDTNVYTSGSSDFISPPTPATQYYVKPKSRGNKNNGDQENGGNGNNKDHREKCVEPMLHQQTITSLKNSLVSGGALVHQKQIEGDVSPMDYTPSPISPAAIIGAGQETLLLPAASSNQRQNSFDQHLDQQNSKFIRQQQHMEWLKAINEQARQAALQQSSSVDSSIGTGVPMFPSPLMPNPFMSTPPEESEEKRTKRLERNRESARKSRRRKKERLETLHKQVNDLHDTLEHERTQILNDMVPQLMQRVRKQGIDECLKTHDSAIWKVLRNTGPTGTPAEAMIEYQYLLLKQNLLPSYMRFVTWLVRQDGDFFSKGKVEYAENEAHKAKDTKAKVVRSTLRITSKQVGESLAEQTKQKAQLSASASDFSRMWPLVAFDMGFSLDQEERFLALFEKAKAKDGLTECTAQTSAAVSAAAGIQKALESLCKRTSSREESCYGAILHPGQLSILLERRTEHGSRYKEFVNDKSSASTGNTFTDQQLYEICRQLKENLRINDKM